MKPVQVYTEFREVYTLYDENILEYYMSSAGSRMGNYHRHIIKDLEVIKCRSIEVNDDHSVIIHFGDTLYEKKCSHIYVPRHQIKKIYYTEVRYGEGLGE